MSSENKIPLRVKLHAARMAILQKLGQYDEAEQVAHEIWKEGREEGYTEGLQEGARKERRRWGRGIERV